VNSHAGLLVGGANIDTADVAVLTRGPANSANPTLGAGIADGQGRVSNYGVFANVFYDVETGTALKPFVGAGAGVQWVDVDYRLSDVNVGSGTKAGIAYQLMAGASYEVTPNVDLLPATLGVQNHQSLITAGVRVKFGG
jgi:opacity protein-like surface antigen